MLPSVTKWQRLNLNDVYGLQVTGESAADRLNEAQSYRTGIDSQAAKARLIGTTSPASPRTVPQNFAHSFIMAARLVNCVPR